MVFFRPFLIFFSIQAINATGGFVLRVGCSHRRRINFLQVSAQGVRLAGRDFQGRVTDRVTSISLWGSSFDRDYLRWGVCGSAWFVRWAGPVIRGGAGVHVFIALGCLVVGGVICKWCGGGTEVSFQRRLKDVWWD